MQNSLIKTKFQIQAMQEGGAKLAKVLDILKTMVKPGVNLLAIEEQAMRLIKKSGGQPAFCRVPGYHWATCLNINEEIVHAIPRSYIIKKGDVVNIDIGMFYKNLNTDMSHTWFVQDQTVRVKSQEDKKILKFLETGKHALNEAIKQVKPGKFTGHISQKIQEIIESAGYTCKHNLTGHGIGKILHEPPAIPCFLNDKIEKTSPLVEGMTLAIEVIYCLGKSDLISDKGNKWTIKTKDGKISAVFEKTIAVMRDGFLILTPLLSG